MEFTIDWLRRAFEADGYISDEDIIVTVYLALRLGKPLLIEGAPGVGKTEIAKVLSRIFNTELIRLQAYEGLDENKALYEWNYQKQLLNIQAVKEDSQGQGAKDAKDAKDAKGAKPLGDLFSEDYLLERPLLKAIRAETTPVLLIDEVDKCDEEFEAFLFEVLSDFTVSVPELGTIAARQIPMVVLTSNSERELSDGLKRRCVYLHIDFPSVDKEIRIINAKVPETGPKLSEEIARAVNYIRFGLEIKKRPSIAETLDWARALLALDADRLTDSLVGKTANMLLKNKEDLDVLEAELEDRGVMSRVEELAKSAGGLAVGLKPGTTPGTMPGGRPAPNLPFASQIGGGPMAHITAAQIAGPQPGRAQPQQAPPGLTPSGSQRPRRGGSPMVPSPPRRGDPR